MSRFALFGFGLWSLTAFSATNVLWMTAEGPTAGDTFLVLRERLRTLRAAHPGETVELRSLDAPEAAVNEMLKFTNGTDVICGDISMEMPATRVMQSGGGGTRPPGWWEDRFARNREMIRTSGGHFDLVLLGDSITHFWERSGGAAWTELTNSCRVLNAGYGGDSARHLIWREINGELDGYTASRAVLMIGTNNRGQPEHIARAVAKSVRILRRKHPETKIVVMAIFPRGAGADDPNRIRNDKVNRLLKPMLGEFDVTWLDIADRFLEPDGTLPRTYFKDLLHPTGAGYRVWLDAIRPVKVCPKCRR